MSSAIVSGASGFIGRALIKRLQEEHIDAHPIPRAYFTNPYCLKEYLRGIKPNYIFHLAAYGNHAHQKDIKQTIQANILNTVELFEATKDIPYRAFISFGSSSEYGRKNGPMKESDFLEPNTIYGATKAASTLINQVLSFQYRKPIITIRPFSVFGEGEADFRFIPTAIRHAIHRTVMDLSPDPKHDWIYIEDFLDGVLKVVENAEKLAGKIVNVGTGVQFSNLDVIKEVEKVSGRTINIDVFGDKMNRGYDNKSWVADNSLLKSLGWIQKHTLYEGLAKTYAYYKQRLEETNP